MIEMVACMDETNGIGKNNKLPWHLPEDLAHFKKLTERQTIVMGRHTFNSIGRVLPNRQIIILTTDYFYEAPEGVLVMHSLEEVLDLANKRKKPIMIVGGGKVYQDFLPFAKVLHLTHIDHRFECDAFFPKFESEEWKLVDIKEAQTESFSYAFCRYARNELI